MRRGHRTLKDMEILLTDIPIDKITTSMTINPPASIIWAMYIAMAEKKVSAANQLGGTIQNDMLKEYVAQKDLIFVPSGLLCVVVDTVEFGTKEVPRLEYHQHQRLSYPGSRLHGRSGTGLYPGRWVGLCGGA